MYSEEEVAQAIYMGIFIATFLLNTGRVLQAIELCKESLILLNEKREFNIPKVCWKKIYWVIVPAFAIVKDFKIAIHYGSKLLEIHRECGEKTDESFITLTLASLYQRQYKYVKAKKLYEKAINMMKEIGDRSHEALAYRNLGTVFHSLSEHVKAKKYLEKAIAICIESGDRNEEGSAYVDLAFVLQDACEYDKAESYHRKALSITKELGNRQGEASCYGNLGNVLKLRGQYVKAKEYVKKSLLIMLEIGDKHGGALAYANLGNMLEDLGDYVTARKCLEKALHILEEVGDKDEVVANYASLGKVFKSLGEYDKAKEHHKKALKISTDIGHRHSEAAAYLNLGEVSNSLGEHDKAKEYCEKALLINVSIGERSGEANCYIVLGTILQSLGQRVQATKYLKKALAIASDIRNKNMESALYVCLANVFQALGDNFQTKECLEKALAISKMIGDRKTESTCYTNLGFVFQSFGDCFKARELLEKALVIKQEIGDRGGEGAVYGSLGTAFQRLGEYVKAKEHYEKALEIMKEIGHKKGEAVEYQNLGALFQNFGEFVKAAEYLEKAVVISKKIGDRYNEGTMYANLGGIYQHLGEYAKVKEYLSNSLAIKKEIGDTMGEAAVYANLGVFFTSLHEYAKARQYLKEALAMNIKIGNKGMETASLYNLGRLCELEGDYVKANECYERVLVISKEIGDIETELRCHCSLTWVRCLEGNGEEVFDTIVASIHSCEKLRSFLEGNDKFKIYLLDRNVSPYLLLSSVFCVAGDSNKALYVLELGRARALADLMSTQYSLENKLSANPQSWVGLESIMKKEHRSICLYISRVFQNIFLWILNTDGVIQFHKNMTAVKISTCTQPKEVFRRFCTATKKHFEDRSLVSLKRHQEGSSFLTNSVASLRLVEEDEDNQNTEPSLAQYYKILIAPVVDLLKEPEIVIIPDRALYQIPFAALPDESGRFLSENFRIRIVPSLTTLKLIQDSPADYHCQTGALIVGDPNVGKVFYKGYLENISRLPFAAKEAEMIGRLLGVNPLLGQHATKHAVLQRISSVSLIHFAAHGNPERGEIALAPVRINNATPQEEDYLLTMAEISQVHLRAKLVVLSCCHSGQGDIKVEGVVGIARAFLGSGARSVLVALWAIEDNATEQFMRCFYEHLVCGESASECLHQAMKWMRSNGYSDVRQWAPFMLIGDNVTLKFGK